MGIDLATWRARIGLNYYHMCRPLQTRWRSSGGRLYQPGVVSWGVGEVMNDTPLVLKGCMTVFALSLILQYVVHSCLKLKERGGYGKVCCHWQGGTSLVRGTMDGGGMLLLRAIVVVIPLLLVIAGDVETNPGPGEPTLKVLLHELHPVCASWYNIGLELDIPYTELDCLQQKYSDQLDLMREMLKYWLKTAVDSPPTWKTVVTALSSPLIKENILAKQLESKYCTPVQCMRKDKEFHDLTVASSDGNRLEDQKRQSHACSAQISESPTTSRARHSGNPSPPLSEGFELVRRNPQFGINVASNSGSSRHPSRERSQVLPFGCGCGKCTFSHFIERGCPTPSPSTSSFPYLNLSGLTNEQQEELIGRLRFESRQIMMQFQELVSKTIKSLIRRSIPLDELVSHVMTLGAFDPVFKESQMPLFQYCFNELKTADTIPKVFLILNDYLSFFNYDIIEHIINVVGTVEDKAELQRYKSTFDQYARRRIYECGPHFGPVSDADHADLFVKVDLTYDIYTVAEIKGFRNKLSETLHISSQGVLRLCQIEKGCIQLIFQLPSFVQQHIFPLSRKQEMTLQAKGVIKLTCREYQFYSLVHSISQPSTIASEQGHRFPFPVEKPQQGIAAIGKVENPEIFSGLTSLLEVDSPYPATLSKYALKPDVADSIRSYQWELALPGLSGQNYIICAPTGTGKTHVAGLIISEHLQQSEGRGRVLFIVNKVPLARQQKEALESIINGVHIEEVTGEMAQSRKAVLEHLSPPTAEKRERNILNMGADIVVSTAGCIFNELLKIKELEISDVTLIIFDECHHTRKNSDYAKIMKVYLQEKRKKDAPKLPQVVGLTASPWAGESSNPSLRSVFDHLICLCAHMDALGGIKVVTRNVEDLDAHTNKPTSELAAINGRDENEPLVALTCEIMSQLEKMLQLNCTHCRWSQQYHGNWILQKEEKYLRVETTSARNAISICHLLKCLSKALAVYMDLTYEDAVEVLEEFSIATGDSATPLEKQLAEVLRQLKVKLATLPTVQNPLLIGLEKILVQQFSQKPDSKAILFVETKKQATGLSRWVSSTPSLSSIRSQVVTGQTRDTGQKMTKAEQDQAIQGFRESQHNLLIATSVLQEGIDVPACNLVVRYQSVSNKIAQVQSKGRARAADSQTFTVISSSSNKRYQELVNEEKVALVEEVLAYFPSGEKLKNTLVGRQEEILSSAAAEEQCVAMHRKQHSAYEVDLLCKKCKKFACNGSDIHTFPSSLHYIVSDSAFKERITIKEHHAPTEVPHGMSRTHKIYCAECGEDWGVIGRWWKDKRTFPVLKCTGFLFRINEQLQSYKKWSKVPFKISFLQ